MADQAQPAAITAAFPAPPPFYKSFTPENLERQKESLASLNESSSEPLPPSTPGIDLLSLPPELRNLFPPAPPPDGKYRSFGISHDISPALPPPSLTPPTPTRLLHLTRTLLLTFLSLTHALATNPGTYGPIWDEMRATYEQIHKVINGYRPHQARETLILMMEEQVERVRGEVRGCEESVGRARGVVEALARGGVDMGGDGVKGVGKEQDRGAGKKRREEKMVWEVLESEVGRT